MPGEILLEPGQYYHVYSRGVDRTNIFMEERNYGYFLQLYAKHISPVADTFAFCLLRNHFHLLVRIRDAPELADVEAPAAPYRAFSNLLNAYAKAINRAYGRSGGLFERPFGRRQVTSGRYYATLVRYIHRNPQKHGLTDNPLDWPYSSYHALLSDKPTRLARTDVLEWFNGPMTFQQAHATPVDELGISELVGDDET